MFRDFSWFQWGCAGFRTERVLHLGGGPTQAVGSCFNLLLCFSISCLVGVSVLVHVIVVRALLMGIPCHRACFCTRTNVRGLSGHGLLAHLLFAA